MDIHTALSALERFSSVTQSNYSSIISIAVYVLSKAENIHVNIEDEKEKIIAQITKLQELSKDISLKLARYQDALISAEHYESICEDEYYSTRDNETDWDYISSLRDNWDDARRKVSRLKDKAKDASSIGSNVTSTIEHLEMMLNAVNRILEVSNNNVYQIKKHLKLLADEANYNMNSLRELINSVDAYLSSMQFIAFSKECMSDAEFYLRPSFVGTSGSGHVLSSKEIQKKVAKRYKVSKEDMKKITVKEQSLLFQKYNPYDGPIKQMLLNTMMCMGPGFQQFVLESLNDVVFVRSRNGFVYDINNKNGRTLRIIGLDITNGYFPVSLYIHISYNLMHGRYINEKLRMNQLVAKEIKRDISKINSKIFKISESIKFKRLSTKMKRSLSNATVDYSSKFFGHCLKLYVEKDYDTLTAIKEAYPESYELFESLLDKTIKWK